LRRIFVRIQGVYTAHSKLRNSLYNAEDGQKDKLDGWIIYCELPYYLKLLLLFQSLQIKIKQLKLTIIVA